ncbi:MAG: tetratricopeptide repeat protein, partial [Bacteroidales bacterium]|nr:tetratricopeptide repeat protein [Bacteroidales bacterium]
KALENAKELYSVGMYAAAERELDKLMASFDDKSSLFYSELTANKVMCAVATGRVDMEGLSHNYEIDFPNDPQASMVKFYLAVTLFDGSDYTKATTLFDSVNEKYLHRSVLPEFNFKYGYCKMTEGDSDGAIALYQKVIDSETTQYTYPAIYYQAYSYYLTQQFAKAFPLFEKSSTDSRFASVAAYYAIESKFMLGDYDYVIEHGRENLGRVSPELVTNLYRILSEAYFAKGETESAKSYLDKYLATGVNISRKDRYYVGLVLYSLGDYRGSIDAFTDVVGAEDQLGQSAAYYSANGYLQVKNKIAAMDSFKLASESDFDATIKEDALFNYAKLSFDLNKDISQFRNYMQRYPRSGKDDIINSYISVSFLSAKDYVSAIDAMRKIKRPSAEVLANLQKAYLFRGAELMEQGGYRSAMEYLKSAIDFGQENAVGLLAEYHYIECLYREDRYSEAISRGLKLMSNRDFRKMSEYGEMHFNLAYAYFRNDDYQNAIDHFANYLKLSPKKSLLNKEARLRLGDALFMQNSYAEAIQEYETAIDGYKDGDLYPYCQSAIAYGLMGDTKSKIATLESAIASNPSSTLYSSALYELGRTYVQSGNNASASNCFNRLLSSNDSTYYAASLLELGMISSNKGDYKGALSYFDRVVRYAPLSSQAEDALAGMESIYQLENKPSEFLSYLDKMGLSSVKSADERELMLFDAAEQIYYSENYSSAISSLNDFVKKYPRGSKSAKAYFYLGESYKALGRKESAADAYLSAMEIEEGECSEAATANYAKISYDLGNYKTALQAYETLIAISTTEANTLSGHLGKMHSHYSSREYQLALQEAKIIPALSGVTEPMQRDADFTAARVYTLLGDRTGARELLERLSQNPTDDIGAEAAYMLVQSLYDTGDFTDVENKVYALAEKGNMPQYWLARCFITLGDSFVEREEWAQARATFESIRDGYTPFGTSDDVPGQLEVRFNKLNQLGR